MLLIFPKTFYLCMIHIYFKISPYFPLDIISDKMATLNIIEC